MREDMRGGTSGYRKAWLSLTAALCAAGVASATPASANEDARAHAIAERFAGASDEARKADEAKKRAEAERLKAVKAAADAKRNAEDAKRRSDAAKLKAERLKADEAEMLARAREEAAEREAEQKRAQAELERAEAERDAREKKLAEDAVAAAQAAEVQRAAAAKLEVEKARAAEKETADKARAEKDRADQLARAQAEADERAAKVAAEQSAQRAAAAKQAAADRQAAEQVAEQRRMAEAEARQAEAERDTEMQRQALEAEREQEAIRLTEKIRKAREAREARQEPGPEPVASTSVAPAGDAAHSARPSSPPANSRVAVLLMMTAGNKGIRRWNKSSDPMLCIDDVCYVSTGAGSAAKRLPRSTAFGPGVALGSRAGACNNSLGCVFRDVDLETASALLQPIDLRIVRHDRREASEVRADDTCAIAGGKLDCRSGVSSSTWRAWIVPEDVAARAGAASLEAALAAGLPVSEARVRTDR